MSRGRLSTRQDKRDEKKRPGLSTPDGMGKRRDYKAMNTMNALSNAHATPRRHRANDAETKDSAYTYSPTTKPDALDDGVSVEYAPQVGKRWYVLRVTYGRINPARLFLKEQGIAHYVPFHYVMKMVGGKRTRVSEPLLTNLLFAYAGKEEMSMAMSSVPENVHLSYYYDHFKTDEQGKNPPLTIDYANMINFIYVTSVNCEHIRLVRPQNCHYKSGDMVRIVDGKFKGVEGRVARIAGQQRVVVELAGLCLVATAYIPTAFIEPVEEEKLSTSTDETTI